MNKRVLLVAAAFSLPLPAAAQSSNFFVAFLNGYQEVPSVSTRGEGIFQAHVSGDRNTVDYVLQYKNMQAAVQQAHIHFAQTAVNGPIVVWLCGSTAIPGPAGTQTCPQEGIVRGTISAANVLGAPATQQLAAGELQEVINAMRAGAAYVNIHTAVSPGGEVRGQLKPW